jgi:hypothetical protein
MSNMRFLPCAVLVSSVLLPLAVAGCGGGEPPPPRVFTPPNYSYLTKLRLNVGEIDIEDHAGPGGGEVQTGGESVSFQSPTPPSVALEEMAHDRLFAAGTSGRAVFVIDQASILRAPNGTLSGLLAVHLDLLTAAGAHGGYAEARVAKQYVPGSEPEDLRGTLYDLTNQMMADMNVELEFQIRKSLKDWVVTTTSVPQPVQAQPLAPPPPPPPTSALPSWIPAPPPQQYGAPGMPDQPAPPVQMSPPPGYLQPPAGAQPAVPGY